jgi:O-antigen/teichoic acid export membrane protein
MQEMTAVKRTLRILAASFAGAAVVFVAVFALAEFGEPPDPDLADGAVLAAAAIGAIGLLVSLQWWSRAGEQPRTPARVQMGFIIRVAIAELGLLIGIMAVFLTGSLTAIAVGMALFLISLLMLVAGLNRIAED